jgi:hypothetical protein
MRTSTFLSSKYMNLIFRRAEFCVLGSSTLFHISRCACDRDYVLVFVLIVYRYLRVSRLNTSHVPRVAQTRTCSQLPSPRKLYARNNRVLALCGITSEDAGLQTQIDVKHAPKRVCSGVRKMSWCDACYTSIAYGYRRKSHHLIAMGV